MKPVTLGNPDCRKTLIRLDAYLSNELSVETTTEVVKHLERCRDCGAAFRIRQLIKGRLQAAVASDPVPPKLRKRVNRTIRKAHGSWISRLIQWQPADSEPPRWE